MQFLHVFLSLSFILVGEARRCPSIPNCTGYDASSCSCRQCATGFHLVTVSLTQSVCSLCPTCPAGYERRECALFDKGACYRATCPRNSVWDGTRCECMIGYRGNIVATTSTPYFEGQCARTFAALARPDGIPSFAPRVLNACSLPHCLSYDLQCGCTNCSQGYFLNMTPGLNTTCNPCQTCPLWQYPANCTTNHSGICTPTPCPPFSQWNGSWCICDSGFRGNLRPSTLPPYVTPTCTDINECFLVVNNCTLTGELCTNFVGGYNCTPCPPEYTSIHGFNCTAMNMCLHCPSSSNNGTDCPCDNQTMCTALNPGYSCSPCPPGTQGVSDYAIAMAENKTFGCFPLTCADNNGGCDPLTICSMINGSVSCGPCPTGFSGNGTTGCFQVNACLQNPYPCANQSTCTFVNLTAQNISSSSCICGNGNCTFVNVNQSFPGSAGKYDCTSYQVYVTKNWTASICNQFTMENGSFSIVLGANILSTQLSCGQTVRWQITDSNNTLVYRSLFFPKLTSPFFSTFVLANCTTNAGCTQVLSCNATGECNIVPNTCFDVNGTMLVTDTANISSLCPVSEDVSLNTCTVLTNATGQLGLPCFVFENLYPFYANGQYICTDAGNPDGCERFANVNGFTLVLSLPFAPSNPTNCTDTFTWTLTNGFNESQTVNATDPRQGVFFGSWPPNELSNCFMTHICSACPVTTTTGNPYTGPCVPNDVYAIFFSRTTKVFVFRCTPNPCINAICTNISGVFTCGACLPGFAGSPCAEITNSSLFRITMLNSNTGVLQDGVTVHIDSFVGQNAIWVNGGAFLSVTTLTGYAIFELPQGNYSLFGLPFSLPVPSNGIGYQPLGFPPARDFFITSYYVPRTLLPNSANTQRVGVLTWQSSNTGSIIAMYVFCYVFIWKQQTPRTKKIMLGTYAVDLNFMVAKYDATTLTCHGLIASCCTVVPGAGPCGAVQIMSDSQNSNGVEECYWSDTELVTATGPFASYLIYVFLTNVPANPFLKQSQAQLNMYSRPSARNVEIAFTLQATTAELNNNLFTPTYWAVACMIRDGTGAISYRTLLNPLNNITSVLTSNLPNVTTYCA